MRCHVLDEGGSRAEHARRDLPSCLWSPRSCPGPACRSIGILASRPPEIARFYRSEPGPVDCRCQETTYACPDPKDAVCCPRQTPLRHMGQSHWIIPLAKGSMLRPLPPSGRPWTVVMASRTGVAEMTPGSVNPQADRERTDSTMMAWRVHEFGPPETMQFERVPRPEPGPGEVLVKVEAVGVGPWDGWIRAGKSALPQPLPLTLGSDLSGEVVGVGPDVSERRVGDQVYGVTNPRFIGAYAEYALASAGMVSNKPTSLSHVEAASVPVIAVTAWQALFDQAQLK
ncbi:hypothetical protein ACVME8_000348 [Bradyrhizobium diazoefficiens]